MLKVKSLCLKATPQFWQTIPTAHQKCKRWETKGYCDIFTCTQDSPSLTRSFRTMTRQIKNIAVYNMIKKISISETQTKGGPLYLCCNCIFVTIMQDSLEYYSSNELFSTTQVLQYNIVA